MIWKMNLVLCGQCLMISSFTWIFSHHPLANASINDIASYSLSGWLWQIPIHRYSWINEETSWWNRFLQLSTGIGGVTYETCWYLRGLTQWYYDMLADPGILWSTYRADFYLLAIIIILVLWNHGDLVDIVHVGDDLAGQEGPLFSPDFYRAVVKPRQKKLDSIFIP